MQLAWLLEAYNLEINLEKCACCALLEVSTFHIQSQVSTKLSAPRHKWLNNIWRVCLTVCVIVPSLICWITHICSCFPLVKAIIEHEAQHGIPPHRIMLGGFSQVGLYIPRIVLYSTRVIFVTQYINKYPNKPLSLCLLTPFLLRAGLCLCILPWPASISWLASWPSVAGYHFTRLSHRYSHTFIVENLYIVLLPPQTWAAVLLILKYFCM